MKQLYTVTHTHDYGADTHLLRSAHAPSVDEVIAFFGIDYEPERGEDIEVNAVNEENISDLPESAENDVDDPESEVS